ncbi:MAG: translation initiation factor IF-2 [Planctomycetota bacterium]
MKFRLYEIAREVGTSAKDVIERAQMRGIRVKNNLSLIDEPQAVAIRGIFADLKETMKRQEQESADRRAKADAERRAAQDAESRRHAAEQERRAQGEAAGRKALEEALARGSRGGQKTSAQQPQKPGVAAPPSSAASTLPPPRGQGPSVIRPTIIRAGGTEAPVEGEDIAPVVRPILPKDDAQTAIRGRALRPIEVDRYATDGEEERRKHRPKPGGAGGPGRGGDTNISEKFKPRPGKRQRFNQPAGPKSHTKTQFVPKEKTKIEIPFPISVKDLSNVLGVRVNQIIYKLMENGLMAKMNDPVPEDAIGILALEFGKEVEIKRTRQAEDVVAEAKTTDRPEDLKSRPPVVTILGHVDHGKTSLLDRIRQADVASGESGGITQHIGAYTVTLNNRTVTFLDTPGHEAFTGMRSRGANVTDIAVLVVAADDGVMPQTEEAYSHAKAAGVPVVVALNKIDKKEANANRVMSQLAALGLNPEEWGGKTGFVQVSALTGKGIPELVERLGLEAELLDLKANPDRPATGAVLEAKLTEGRGPLATVLVQNGTLRKGDVMICGAAYGRVRALYDDKGSPITEAGPAMPAEITGLSTVPSPGDTFQVIADIDAAREVADGRTRKGRETALLSRAKVTVENLSSLIASGQMAEVRVVLKCDVKGSLEVLNKSLSNLTHLEVKIRIIHSAVGSISESDVLLASASDAIVLGFHVPIDDRARVLATEKGVQIRTYTVIYQVIEEMKLALEGLLVPDKVEVVTGQIQVKETFRISRVGTIAGCLVVDGKVERSNQVRVIRDKVVIHTGRLENLKRFKDDAREVAEGFECGLKIAGFDDIRVGDTIQSFTIQEKPRKLES